MITIWVSYDSTGRLPSATDDSIESALRPHCQDLQREGSGINLGSGQRDLEFWATAVDPDISFEYVLEPLFLNNMEVTVDEFDDETDDG